MFTVLSTACEFDSGQVRAWFRGLDLVNQLGQRPFCLSNHESRCWGLGGDEITNASHRKLSEYRKYME